MDIIKIRKRNEVFLEISAERGILQELSDVFTFYVPGYKFMPAFRNKMWDGKIRLLNVQTRTLYVGLLSYIEEFAKTHDCKIEYDSDFSKEKVSAETLLKFSRDILKEANSKFEIRDYQLEALHHCIMNHRSLLLSPTASGKSLIIYLLSRWYDNEKKLIIVPTTGLVSQLKHDFIEYGLDVEKNVQMIFAGQTKTIDKEIVLTTWQSVWKMPPEWFAQFGVVIGDEAHGFKAKSLTTILEKMPSCKFRFGTTGTLDGTQTHKYVLEGLFGRVKQVTTTAELMSKGTIANLKINAIVLKYPEELAKALSKSTYQQEIDFIVRFKKRNTFIKNLVKSLKGNTLVLYQYVEKHGEVLHEMISKECEDCHFVSGKVDKDAREEIRLIVNKSKNAKITASMGTFSTGINIPNIKYLVFASPSKARIRTLQAIGRALRKSETKDSAELYDIADDIKYKSRTNYTLDHFVERIKYYNEESLDYNIVKVDINV